MKLLFSILLTLCSCLTICNSCYSQYIGNAGLTPRMLDSINCLLYFPSVIRYNKSQHSTPFIISGSGNYRNNKILSGIDDILTSDNCQDTSSRIILNTYHHTYYSFFSLATKDSNILTCGEAVIYDGSNTTYTGFVIKVSEKGKVIWAKLYDSLAGSNQGDFAYQRMLELKDGSIMLAGYIADPITANHDVVLTKIDQQGEIIWSRMYRSKLWLSNGYNSDNYFGLRQISEDPESGDIFFTGVAWANGRSITRVAGANGAVKWSKLYAIGGGSTFDNAFGMDVTTNEVRSFSRLFLEGGYCISAYRINKVNGDTIATKFFRLSDTAGIGPAITGENPMIKLNNGHYLLPGKAYGSLLWDWDGVTPLYQASVVELDNDLNFVKGLSFRSNIQGNGGFVLSLYPDGSGMFTMQQSVGGDASWMYDFQFRDGQVVKQRKRYYDKYAPIIFPSIRLSDGGDMTMKTLINNDYVSSEIEMLRLHSSDTASDCLGLSAQGTFLQPHNYIPETLFLDSIQTGIFFDGNQETLGTENVLVNTAIGCEIVSHCDSIKIIPSADSICFGNSINLHIQKNIACGATPYFNYDTSAITSFKQINDSTYNVQFKYPWQGYIHASVSTCFTVEDSVKLTVLSPRAKLNLGPDTLICPGNTVTLNAGAGFTSYQWQDGSTDSVFKVMSAGKYFIKVTNACGGIETDTVLVNPYAAKSFTIGPDISICRGDSAIVNASAGFSNYQWTPVYNISADTGISVIIKPAHDTVYRVIAEQRAGCFAYDTLNVKVNQINPVALGNDTSFCEGQSIILDAGIGYNSYNWNTGSAAQKITVTKAGIYIATVTLNGCKAKDSLNVTNVSPLPSFTLGNDTTLCEGQQLSYQFNLQNTVYKWSDGSTLSNNSFSQPGSYWLTVDQQGCSKSDTVILIYKPLPVVHLGNDTTLCNGITLVLDASNNNATYTWQDGNNNASYQTGNAGRYFVTVNINNCLAKDTINISYIPSPQFTLGPDLILCKGIEYKLLPTMNTKAEYLWQDGSNQPFFNITTEGYYALTATNICGSLTDSVKATVALCTLNMPSAFTPNKDGINDIFRVKYPFPVSKFNMAIYNRWGQKIFESSDITRGWDGTFKGLPSNMDTYIWVISLTDTEGKKQNAQGTVTLIR